MAELQCPLHDRADQGVHQLSVAKSLTATERERFLHIVEESLTVDRHFQLFLWLQGEIQYFLPHVIFIGMFGDFDAGNIAIDIVSPLPKVRTSNCIACGVHRLAAELHPRWRRNGFQMLSIGGGLRPLARTRDCQCPIAPILDGGGSMLAHGVRDERSGQDTLYLLMHPESVLGERQRGLLGMLLPQIDFVCRRMVSLQDDSVVSLDRVGQNCELSARELEILEWVRQGKTNLDIGRILNISAFTVKNHLQRIYRKMDVLNRAQAVAKYEDMGRRS